MHEVNLNDVVRLIWRRKWVLVLTVAVCLGAALFWGLFLKTPSYQARMYIYLEKNDYLIRTYRGNYLSQLSSGMNRKVFLTNDRVWQYLLQDALNRGKDIPRGRVSVFMQLVEVTTSLTPEDARKFDDHIPRIMETLTAGLDRHYREHFELLKAQVTTIMQEELKTLEQGAASLEKEIRELEAAGKARLVLPGSSQPVLDPYFQELNNRKAETQAHIYNLKHELPLVEEAAYDDYYSHINLVLMGHQVVNQTTSTKMVLALALVLGMAAGLMIIYLMSLGSLREMLNPPGKPDEAPGSGAR